MSSKTNENQSPTGKLTLRRRILGFGVLGGVLSGVAAVIAMSTAVGGVALLSNASDTTAPTAKAAAYAPAAKATTKQVMIENYAYSPATLSIAVGDTVTWTNMDSAPHTVTVSAGPEKFASPNLAQGDTFTHTFTLPGTYQYYCAVHPDMKGSITVTGSGTAPTTPDPTAPATPTTPTTGHGGGAGDHGDMPTTEACGGAMSAVETLMQHLYAGHLETSVGDQVKDIAAADQYIKTHTVLVENMLKPLLGGSDSAVQTLLQHVYSGHLETSVGDQVKDILSADQYVKTHTVLVENMVKPLLGGDGTC